MPGLSDNDMLMMMLSSSWPKAHRWSQTARHRRLLFILITEIAFECQLPNG